MMSVIVHSVQISGLMVDAGSIMTAIAKDRQIDGLMYERCLELE